MSGILLVAVLLIGFILFFMISIIDYMKKTSSQRADQIAQMDRFIALYKRVNGLDQVEDQEEDQVEE